MAQSNEQGGEGLRQKIRCALGYCEANQHECIFESSRNASQELDLIMQLIALDRKQHELDARIEELDRLMSTKLLQRAWIPELDDYYNRRTEELKAERDQLGGK